MGKRGDENVVTFAYGSNMLTARLRERCPSARSLGVAEIIGYELRWHKRSNDGSGKCDIVSTGLPDAVVLGVLYEIAADEKPDLDRAEGVGYGYDEKKIQVVQKGVPRTVVAYLATETDAKAMPYTWYKDLVVAGAKEHGLPDSYLAHLFTTVAAEDQDRRRHDKHARLLSEVARS